MKARLLLGDCRESMRAMDAESIDAIVSDPPYGLSFMGKGWDHDVPGQDFWTEALRVAKPGAHLLAFGGTRTFHRLVVAIEDAGWEIRDSLIWNYGTGFPKSLNVSIAIDKQAGAMRHRGKAITVAGNVSGRDLEIAKGAPAHDPITDAAKRWQGWGTGLKPAFEPVVVARKPLIGTVADNVLRYGTGALNINSSRVGTEGGCAGKGAGAGARVCGNGLNGTYGKPVTGLGRWPANVIFTHAPGCGDECAPGCPVAALDAQSGVRKGTKRHTMRRGATTGTSIGGHGVYGKSAPQEVEAGYGDTGAASRFFTTTEYGEDDDLPGAEPGAPPFYYASKASQSEREAGCGDLPARSGAEAVNRDEGSAGAQSPRAGAGRTESEVRNHHPTVKPVAVMRWLVRLAVPKGGIVLDPFMGSGTTGVAAMREGVLFIGCEREAEYLAIAEARIRHAEGEVEPLLRVRL